MSADDAREGAQDASAITTPTALTPESRSENAWPSWLEEKRSSIPLPAQRAIDLLLLPPGAANSAAVPTPSGFTNPKDTSATEHGVISKTGIYSHSDVLDSAQGIARLSKAAEKLYYAPSQLNQDSAIRVAERSAGFAAFGSLCGVFMSIKHHTPTAKYALGMGVNFFLVSGLYFSVLEVANVIRPEGKGDPFQCGLIGAGTGAAVVQAFGSPMRIPGGAVMAGLFCAAGALGLQAFEEWRLSRGEQIKADYARISSKTNKHDEQA